MTEILELHDFFLLPTPAGWVAHFECVIDDMVVINHATVVDPAEYGPALCTGSLLLSDDSTTTLLDTADVPGQIALAQDVDNWQMV